MSQKNVSLIERVVQQFRMMVLKILHVNLASDSQKTILDAQKQTECEFEISLEEAENFFKQTNQLYFIRKSIIGKRLYKNVQPQFEEFIRECQNGEEEVDTDFEAGTDYTTYRDDL